VSSFGTRLRAAVADRGRLCVGIDPHESLLAQWGLDASAAGVREFGLRVVDAAAGQVAVVKPQVSFFERWGAAGFAALETVVQEARAAELIVIADAKRGDIGSTMDAYAEAWLTPGSPLEADALTVNPYLGVGTLDRAFTLAETHCKGVFVLAATSDPAGFGVQRARGLSGETVSASVVREVSDRNARTTAAGEWAALGFVIGATVDWTDAGLSAFVPPAPILAPGFGHQGAGLADLARYGSAAPQVLASESRSILSAGPDRIAQTIALRAEQYRSTSV
jgi:orotidine-5'-phosphate decarboxylase